MLLLHKIFEKIKITTESDFYVPMKLVFGSINKIEDPLVYCEFKGLKSSLIEFKIGQNSGKIYSLIILDFKKESLVNKDNIWDFVIDKKIGLPAFVVPDFWKKEYILDINNNFKVQLSKTFIRIFFSDNEILLKVSNERVNFGFDKNKYLCCVEINDLSEIEKESLKEYL